MLTAWGCAIGKSSIIRQYVSGDFKAGYLFTIGGTHDAWWPSSVSHPSVIPVDFALKVIDMGKNQEVKLQVRTTLFNGLLY